GNCASFCPYDSRPYKDKFTYFRNERDFNDSTNTGFMVLDVAKPCVRVRLDGQVADYDLTAADNGLPADVECFILTVVRNYCYLL
ncbi:MAG: putative selenate reductase subunit YgfK, partial [Clostridia bacterium]|nr:putative selenate reductase subunit YgfK [Clostridia bacterium]